ncbi:methyltransferase domain-containing protein [Novosphingobium endophyticum]|uniref:methyltransferase domain-containing protein n=1 Tax=Novosphingobium endophyticum TaxID=1955250 RepID=UPI00166D98A8|nr:class I SAM-dependent methyltransferase [Novosphingobium endophyticum]
MKIASVGRFLVLLCDGKARFHAYRAVLQYRSSPERNCPICGFHGRFVAAGHKMRFDCRCPRCRSVERHRLFALAVQRNVISFRDADVLHFAPDPFVTRLIEGDEPRSHLTCDLKPGRADVVQNIEKLEFDSDSFDRIVCSHVLEHVDDRAALAELYRVLRPGGLAILSVPIIEGWAQSYEDSSIVSEQERSLHFGQCDHVRYYGSDFRDRVREAGFSLDEFTSHGKDCARYGLTPGGKLFLGTK